MKRLILMRHAKSDWSAPEGGDHERPLNARGRANAKSLGIWLGQMDLAPDAVLCSSAARTRETLALLDLQKDPVTVFTRALYLADAEQIMTELRTAKCDTVLMIGHNPGICDMATQIINTVPLPESLQHYPTCATLVATFNTKTWAELDWHTGHITHAVVPRDLPVADEKA